jgi:hypothetical protein
LESERLPSVACLRLFYVPLTFLDSSVRFWDFAVPIRCFFCCLTALVRSLSLGTAFSLHVFCLHVKIHMLLLYMYIYIFINGHTVYFLWDGAGGWSTLVGCLHVCMSLFPHLQRTRIKLADHSRRLPIRVIFLLLLNTSHHQYAESLPAQAGPVATLSLSDISCNV